jgi:hypothetical protein
VFTIRNLMALLGLTALVLSISGCTYEKDVTALDTFRGQNIWKSYKRNAIYQLKEDLFYGLTSPASGIHELIPPYGSPATIALHARHSYRDVAWQYDPKTHKTIEIIPKTIEDFNLNPARFENIKGVVPRGVRLRMQRVTTYYHSAPWDLHYVGVFMDGPFAGKPVNLDVISEGSRQEAKGVDPDFLEEVKFQ